jgi:hypothetical protein
MAHKVSEKPLAMRERGWGEGEKIPPFPAAALASKIKSVQCVKKRPLRTGQ